MQTAHDPYLITVKRSMDEQKIKIRKKKFQLEIENKPSKNFLYRDVNINYFQHLPKGVQKFLFIGFSILFPYIIGTIFIFFALAYASLETYYNLQMNSFMLSWIIGYECLAFILLLFIIKSAFCFRKS